MSYGPRAYIIHRDLKNNEHEFILYKRNHSGESIEWKGSTADGVHDFQHENIDPSQVYGQIQHGWLEIFPFAQNQQQLDVALEIVNADARAFQIEWRVNGTREWIGYVQTGFLEYEEVFPRKVNIVAKDFSILKDEPFRLDGDDIDAGGDIPGQSPSQDRVRVIELFATILRHIGLGLPIQTATSWTYSQFNQNEDFLYEAWADRSALRDIARDEEEDLPVDTHDLLDLLCRNYGIILRQKAGRYQLVQVTAYEQPAFVRRFFYNEQGGKLSSEVSQRYVTIDQVERFMLPSTISQHNEGLKRVETTWEHRVQVQNLFFPRRVELDSDNTTHSQTQFFDSYGEQQLELSARITATVETTVDPADPDVRTNPGRIFATIFSGTQYWNGSSWQDEQATVEIPFQFGLSDQGYEADFTLIEETADTPVGGGELEIILRRAQIKLEGEWRQVETTVWLDTELKVRNPTVEEGDTSAIAYSLSNANQNFISKLDIGATWYGDGPTSNAFSAHWYLDNGTIPTIQTASRWRRRGENREINFHHLLLAEAMDFQRSPRRNLNAEILADYFDAESIYYDNKYFFYIGGRFTSRLGVWEADFVEINVESVADEFESRFKQISDEGGSAAGSSRGTTVGYIGAVASNLFSKYVDQMAVATLDQDIDGEVAPDTPVDILLWAPVWEGQDMVLVNRDTEEFYQLTVAREPGFEGELQRYNAGRRQIRFEPTTVGASKGDPFQIVPGEQQAFLTVKPAAIIASVEGEREGEGVGQLLNSINEGDTVSEIDILANKQFTLKDSKTFTLVRRDGRTEDIEIDGDQDIEHIYEGGPPSDWDTINIVPKTFSYNHAGFPGGSKIRKASKDTAAELSIQEGEIDLRVKQDELISSINLTPKEARINSDRIRIDGETIFESGFDPSDGKTVIRASTEPTERPSGDDLQEGDVWIDTSDGDRPYSWAGSIWSPEYTRIDGGNIVASDALLTNLLAQNATITGRLDIGDPTTNGIRINSDSIRGWGNGNLNFYLPINGQGPFIDNLEAGSKIGDWEVTDDNILRSAESGARIQLDPNENRISVFDSVGEKAVMGYLTGLTQNLEQWDEDIIYSFGDRVWHDGANWESNTNDNDSEPGTNDDWSKLYEIDRWGANDYGFWAKQGDRLRIDGDVRYNNGDWLIENDASFLILDGSTNERIIALGTDRGNKGLFLYDGELDEDDKNLPMVSLTKDGLYAEDKFEIIAPGIKITPDEINFGDDFIYTDANGLQVKKINAAHGTISGFNIFGNEISAVPYLGRYSSNRTYLDSSLGEIGVRNRYSGSYGEAGIIGSIAGAGFHSYGRDTDVDDDIYYGARFGVEANDVSNGDVNFNRIITFYEVDVSDSFAFLKVSDDDHNYIERSTVEYNFNNDRLIFEGMNLHFTGSMELGTGDGQKSVRGVFEYNAPAGEDPEDADMSFEPHAERGDVAINTTADEVWMYIGTQITNWTQIN